jgi:hypothetical protein
MFSSRFETNGKPIRRFSKNPAEASLIGAA